MRAAEDVPDFREVPLAPREVAARCRSIAATALILGVTLQLFRRNDGYASAFQYHPICMMVAFVMVLPDVASSFKQLKNRPNMSQKDNPASYRLFRDEAVLRHQLAAFAMEVAAALGFAAVEYAKITNNRPHLTSPHGMTGAVCGAAILCQMVLGTMLRYVLAPGVPLRRKVVAAHKAVSLTIAVTGMLCIAGGFLATSYAELMFPSSTVRSVIAFSSVGIAVAGFLL